MLYNYIHVFKMQHVTSATSPGTGKGGHGDGYIAIHLYPYILIAACVFHDMPWHRQRRLWWLNKAQQLHTLNILQLATSTASPGTPH